MSARIGPDAFELVPHQRARRGLATVNVAYEDKEVFDAIHMWLSHLRGRTLAQWDVFSYLLAEALANKDSALHGALLFPEEILAASLERNADPRQAASFRDMRA